MLDQSTAYSADKQSVYDLSMPCPDWIIDALVVLKFRQLRF